jgi:MICOS complex subunit MIC60
LYVKKQSAKKTKNDEFVHEKTSDDGKIVLDIIEAIHAAEKKQADSDAYVFSEEKRKLKVCLSLFHSHSVFALLVCYNL